MDNEQKKHELARAAAYAHRIYSIRPRSVAEMTEKLTQKGFSEEIVHEVIEGFKKKSFLDDKKFAKLWVESRMTLRPKGAFLLRQELEEKGIEQDIIETALGQAKQEYNEEEIAKNLAIARLKTFGKIHKLKAKKRIFDFLRRRGFSSEVAYRVIKGLFKEIGS